MGDIQRVMLLFIPQKMLYCHANNVRGFLISYVQQRHKLVLHWKSKTSFWVQKLYSQMHLNKAKWKTFFARKIYRFECKSIYDFIF